MELITKIFWLIAIAPLISAGIIAILDKSRKKLSAGLAIGALSFSLILSIFSLIKVIAAKSNGSSIFILNFDWIKISNLKIEFGFILDPLSSLTAVVVALVGLLIFIYSIGYMEKDWNFTKFFCFMSLFIGAMLGLVISNSVLLLFIFWEIVGLTSYLLIGFWFNKPSAAAAAKKAFITTRVGDLAFFIGILILFGITGKLLLYDNGGGCLEKQSLDLISQKTILQGLSSGIIISILIFIGAMGKSGQVPLHIWLPDAMEGPTPVSALIHAATMVAAGVYLVARMNPLIILVPPGYEGISPASITITFVGAITALVAALIAVAQFDIKRILAYSTISQLGFMMMGLGAGGVVVAMFHLITHAFFKSLLFLGAGSVIHSCNEQQDIRHLGGLKSYMPVTFAVYAVGMMALAGVPLFSGFWSKDEILHSASIWSFSKIPFYIGLLSAFLTAFYMTRQVCYIFAGKYRGIKESAAHPHESPPIMVYPMIVLAVFAFSIGFIGTPFLPLLQNFLSSAREIEIKPDIFLMLISSVVAFVGIISGWLLYGKSPIKSSHQHDILEVNVKPIFNLLAKKLYFDEFYEVTVIRLTHIFSRFCYWLDVFIWSGVLKIISNCAALFAWLSRLWDEFLINGGFDGVCNGLKSSGLLISLWRNGKVQRYLCLIGISVVVLVLWIVWGIN